MPVAIAIWTVFSFMLCLTRIGGNFLRESLSIGIAWLLFSIILDLLIYPVILKMLLPDYLSDIAETYLIILTITIGFGHLMDHSCAAAPGSRNYCGQIV